MRIQKTIAEFTGKRGYTCVAPSESVANVAAAMKKDATDCALVCEPGGVLVGIFTAWDLLSRVAARRLPADTTPVSEVMTAKPETLEPEACITYAMNRMAHGGYRNVPIVDSSGRAVANLSVRELMAHLADVFAELDDVPDPPEWTDLGGGG